MSRIILEHATVVSFAENRILVNHGRYINIIHRDANMFLYNYAPL